MMGRFFQIRKPRERPVVIDLHWVGRLPSGLYKAQKYSPKCIWETSGSFFMILQLLPLGYDKGDWKAIWKPLAIHVHCFFHKYPQPPFTPFHTTTKHTQKASLNTQSSQFRSHMKTLWLQICNGFVLYMITGPPVLVEDIFEGLLSPIGSTSCFRTKGAWSVYSLYY